MNETLCPPLNLPAYAFETRERKGRVEIYDPVRRRHVRLTPEEWVRQNVVQYLIHGRGYPQGLTGIEHTVETRGQKRRCDVVVFDRRLRPSLIVECKAPTRDPGQRAIGQAAVYGAALGARALLVTNGLLHHCCRIEDGALVWLPEIPRFEALGG